MLFVERIFKQLCYGCFPFLLYSPVFHFYSMDFYRLEWWLQIQPCSCSYTALAVTHTLTFTKHYRIGLHTSWDFRSWTWIKSISTPAKIEIWSSVSLCLSSVRGGRAWGTGTWTLGLSSRKGRTLIFSFASPYNYVFFYTQQSPLHLLIFDTTLLHIIYFQ